MTTDDINYKRLSYLGDRVRAGNASKPEKDEFMNLLYQNGSINDKQYRDYINNQNTEGILKAALAVGAIVLLGYIISQAFGNDR